MQIKHLVLLIHPCVYEALQQNNPEEFRKNNCELYLEREHEVKQRWLAALPSLDKATLFLQLDGPEHLLEAARELLGAPKVCRVHAEARGWDTEDQVRDYYRALTACVRAHMGKFDLGFDPATVTCALWGESFEGCVPGFGGAFAEYLGLKQPPKLDFEMTVYDSRFLYGARRWEVIPLSGTDIEAWIFECHDGTGAATFQARLTAQWLDKRPILLRLNPARIQVCNKRGHTIWPPAPGGRSMPDDIWPYCLSTSGGNMSGCYLGAEYWVRSVRMAFDDFREVIAAAALASSGQVSC